MAIPASHPPLEVHRRTGSEPFTGEGAPAGATLLGFWQWAMSDLTNNATRGLVAEYLVACAVGVEGGVRSGWDAYDVLTPSGIRVEVKSSSRWQTWGQKSPSLLQFGIRPTREWSAETNEMAAEARRQADVYVFAVLECADKACLDPLELGQWRFYVLPTSVLNEAFPIQKMVSLKALERVGAVGVGFGRLAEAVAVAGTANER